MSLTVPVGEARAAFDASVTAFSDAVAALPEWELLASSRCHGWTRLDVAVHVVAGWQEMLGGFVTVAEAEPTVDAASYWTAFAELTSGSDPVEVLMAQRRRGATYARPSALLGQLRDVADAVLTGRAACACRHAAGKARCSRRATSSRSGPSRTWSTSSTCWLLSCHRAAGLRWPARRSKRSGTAR